MSYSDTCTRCGHARREHCYDGCAAYINGTYCEGCDVFVEPTPPLPAEVMSDSEERCDLCCGDCPSCQRPLNDHADVQAKLARLAQFEALAREAPTCGTADCNDPVCRLAALAQKGAM